MNGLSLDIRYVKLHFLVEYTDDCIVPKSKSSALRGGMGEMLLRANCIRNRKCEECDFESECLVQRIMYSKMNSRPDYMTLGDSVGYVLECEDYHTSFLARESMRFNLILFGKTTVYFSQLLNALYALGVEGYGKEKARYVIKSVQNSIGQAILSDRDIRMEYYKVLKVSDYVDFRMKQFESASFDKVELVFKSPLSLRIQGNMLKEFSSEAFFKAVCRRIHILNYFEGNENVYEMPAEVFPTVLSKETHMVQIKRYSNRKQEKMAFQGMEGKVELELTGHEWLPVLLAGELIHVGKYTSFGLGRYRVRN